MSARDDWWTVEEACEATGRGERTIRRWAKDEDIRRWRPKRILYLHKDDVLKVEATMTARIEHPERATRK